MELPFAKMNGAGNDFIMIDNRAGGIHLSAEQLKWLCDRRRGIGADGVIVVESEAEVDFRMRYYNADGGEAEMCGNGARCVALFARQLGLGDADRLRFMTPPGLMEARVGNGRASISMTEATSFEANVSLSVAQGEEIVHFISTGVPHAVVIESDVQSLSDGEIVTRGRSIRAHPRFAPTGCNADFVTIQDDGTVRIRTYERGVEAETLACGTGSVAAAVVLAHLGLVSSPVRLITHGGDALSVSFATTDSGARDVVLEGPAAWNFRGSVQLPE